MPTVSNARAKRGVTGMTGQGVVQIAAVIKLCLFVSSSSKLGHRIGGNKRESRDSIRGRILLLRWKELNVLIAI